MKKRGQVSIFIIIAIVIVVIIAVFLFANNKYKFFPAVRYKLSTDTLDFVKE